jgi:hypothetical protein
METPTVAQWIESGLAFVARLAEVVSLRDISAVSEALSYRKYQQIAPWIRRVKMVHPKTGNQVSVDDPSALVQILDQLQSRPEVEDFSKDFFEIYNDNRCSHFAALYSACPKCGREPEQVVNGLLPLDMLYVFFMIVVDDLSR